MDRLCYGYPQRFAAVSHGKVFSLIKALFMGEKDSTGVFIGVQKEFRGCDLGFSLRFRPYIENHGHSDRSLKPTQVHFKAHG